MRTFTRGEIPPAMRRTSALFSKSKENLQSYFPPSKRHVMLFSYLLEIECE